MIYFIGIDPGSVSGAFALIIDSNIRLVKTERFKDRTEKEMCEILRAWKKSANTDGADIKAIIENVHLFPGQGISSGGKFMRNKGIIEGWLMALNIPYERVSPQRWVKSYGMKKDNARGETQSQWKKRLRQRAQELFPNHKIVAENADALLIANYLTNLD